MLWAIAHALGTLWDRRCLEPLLSLAIHNDEAIRLEVAQGFHGAMAEAPDPRGIKSLIRLSIDPDSHVRDWATFGLGQVEVDSAEIRQALRARLDDLDHDARDEAVCGLARRRDRSVLPVVTELLALGTAAPLVIEAAAYLADPILVPLLKLYSEEESSVSRALLECDPGRREERDQKHAEFLVRVQEQLELSEPGSVASLSCERLGIEVTLTVNCAAEDTVWALDALLEAVGGDPSLAANRVLTQLGRA